MDEYVAKKQFVDLSRVELCGRILDVGGGGEGVISRLAGDSVVAIDRRADELEETAGIGLKIVMDACHMAFLDAAFESVTSFYTLMYMSVENCVMFFREAYRVLKPNGRLWIWDTNMSKPNGADVFIVPLEITLPSNEVITTGYGVGWKREQSAEAVAKAATDAGFAIEKAEACEGRFEMVCRKS